MKKLLLSFFILSVILIMSSCTVTYYAWVTIDNVGDFTITVIVDDNPDSAVIIQPREQYTYEIQWEDSKTTSVYLYAYITNNPSYYDSETIYLEDGDEATWQVGWASAYNKTSKVLINKK